MLKQSILGCGQKDNLYIKKKNRLPDTALRKGKSSLLIGQLHLVLLSGDTRRRCVRELIFHNIVPHPFKASNGKRDDGDLTLWLSRTLGDAITSPPPLLHAPPETEGHRIIMTGIGSPAREVRECWALPLRWEVPPPAQCETLNLSEKKDSLSKAPRWVSFEEEPSMEMTSQSTRGCWIESS